MKIQRNKICQSYGFNYFFMLGLLNECSYKLKKFNSVQWKLMWNFLISILQVALQFIKYNSKSGSLYSFLSLPSSVNIIFIKMFVLIINCKIHLLITAIKPWISSIDALQRFCYLNWISVYWNLFFPSPWNI